MPILPCTAPRMYELAHVTDDATGERTATVKGELSALMASMKLGIRTTASF